MRNLLVLLLTVITVSAFSQFSPNGSKTRFVNGIGLSASRTGSSFNTADSLVLFSALDSSLYFKYKGTARALMYAANVGTQIHDSLYAVWQLKAGTSAGARLVSNSGTVISEWGLGGSANMDFHGFAGYDANRSASYTARSFTDKNYVDSTLTNGYVDLTSNQTILGLKSFTTYLRTVTSGSTGLQAYNSQRGYFIGMIAGSTDSLFVINYDSGYSQAKTRVIEAKKTGELKIPFLTTNGVVTSTSGWLGSQSYSSLASSLSGNWLPITGGYLTGSLSVISTSTSAAGLTVIGGSSVGTPAASSGQILIGNSSAYRGSIAYDDNTGYMYIDNLYDNSNSNIYLRVRTNGTPINAISVLGTGNINLYSLGTGTVYSNSGTLTNTNPSDSTLKNTIKPLGYGLAEVLKLQPKTFYYNSDSSKNSLKYGFIAQDVKKIMPDVVREFNVYKSVDTSFVNEFGVLRKSTKDIPIKKLGLETDGIYVTLVKAIQEQQAIIDDLKKRIIALENK